MNTVLFLSLVIILSAALPWWPNSAYGRSRHHRPRDNQPLAYETKVFDQRREALLEAAMKLKALDPGPTPEASQQEAMKKLEALDRGPTPECDSNPEMHQQLRRHFEERWVAATTNNIDDGCVAADGPTEPAGDNAPSSKERKVIQSGVFEGKSFSIFDDGSIEIETGSGLQQFKNFVELRAAAARISHDGTGQTNPRSPRETKPAETPAGHG
jgi:hypothetical protein